MISWHGILHRHFTASKKDVGEVYVCALRLTGKVVSAVYAPANEDFRYGIPIKGETELRTIAAAKTAQEALRNLLEEA